MDEKSKGERKDGNPPHQVAAGLEDNPRKKMPLPVWFFVGMILAIYGVMILITGILEFSHPPATVLARLHPAIWWGCILCVVGVLFVYLTGPWKSKR